MGEAKVWRPLEQRGQPETCPYCGGLSECLRFTPQPMADQVRELHRCTACGREFDVFSHVYEDVRRVEGA